MNDHYEVRGHWWLPGREDKKIPGDLKFDPESGGTLTLMGALSLWTDYAEPQIGENGGGHAVPDHRRSRAIRHLSPHLR